MTTKNYKTFIIVLTMISTVMSFYSVIYSWSWINAGLGLFVALNNYFNLKRMENWGQDKT